MAKASFFCIPAHGHVNPTLPLVAELVKRGERIDYWTGAEFRPAIEKTGATFQSLPSVFDKMHSLDLSGGLFALGEFMADVTLSTLPELKASLETVRPDYLLYDSMSAFGRLLAQMLQLPSVATFPSFGALPDRLPLPPVPLLMLFTGLGRLPLTLRNHRNRQNLAKQISRAFGVDELKFGNIISNPAACNVVFTSERFQIVRDRLDERFHFVGPCIAERVPDPTFPLAALNGNAVIYISLGTVFYDKPEFFRACLDAFGGSPETVVMSVGRTFDISKLGTIPANFIVRGQVPQIDVLKRAAVFITHGGMNSVSEGLFHDVPLLVFPQAADQFLVANRVAELGCGRRISDRDLRPQRLRQMANEMMHSPRTRTNVQLVGKSLREAGGVQRAADLVMAARGIRSLQC